jgi:hypothetical protein
MKKIILFSVLFLFCHFQINALDNNNSSACIEKYLPPPPAPTFSIIAPTCTAIGRASITNFDSALSYTFNPIGPTVNAAGEINGLTCGVNYAVIATNATNEASPTSNLTVGCQQPAPSTPNVEFFDPVNCNYRIVGALGSLRYFFYRDPIINNNVSTINQGTSITINPLNNDVDVNNYLLTVQTISAFDITGSSFNLTTTLQNVFNGGVLAGQASIINGNLIFNANPTYLGNVSFQYTTNNGVITQNGTITVNCVIASPTAQVYPQNDYNAGRNGQTLNGNVLNNDQLYGTSPLVTAGIVTFNSNNFPLTIGTPLNIAGAGNFTLQANGNYTFIPLANFSSNLSLNYTVCNAEGDCENATLNLGIFNLRVVLVNASSSANIISNIACNQTYNILAANNNNCSSAFTTFTTNCLSAPLVNTTPGNPNGNGTGTIVNFNPAYSYVFNPAGPAINATGGITNFQCGIQYTVSAFDPVTSCQSALTNFSISCNTIVRINKIRNNAADLNFDPQAYYSAADIVNFVLIPYGGDCLNIQNVFVEPPIYTGTTSNTTFFTPSTTAGAQNNANDRSWGYYRQGNSNFTFEEGLVLSTGYARRSGNEFINPPGTIITGIINNPATAQYNTFRNTLEFHTGSTNLTDLTGFQFNFTAQGSSISFEYMLSSEEYTSNFPCNFYDSFALLIKPTALPDTPANWTNLAFIPGTTIPVTIQNIHGAGTTCGPQNIAWFDNYYPGSSHNTLPVSAAMSNLNGFTQPLLANFPNLVPGDEYTFRFLVADRGDRQYDTSIFISGEFTFDFNLENENGQIYPIDNGYFVKDIDCVDENDPTIIYLNSSEDISAIGDVIVLQNPECLHVGDILDDIVNKITDSTYLTYGVYSLDKDTTNTLYDLPYEHEHIFNMIKSQITPMNNINYVGEGQCCWYNHSIHRPAGYHFVSAITKVNMDKLNGFDERYSNGIGFDDDEFLFRVKMLGLDVQIHDEPFAIHQWHYSENNFFAKSDNVGEAINRNQNVFNTITKNLKTVHVN